MSGRFSSRRGLVILGGLAGVVLFGATLHGVDPATILAGVRRVGVGFLLIFAVAGVRLAARAWAWTACAGGPSRLPLSSALAAVIVGEGAGNLTPLGPAASEPAKVVWVRRHLGTIESAASLAVETLVYSVAAAIMLAAGSLAWVAALAPSARGLAATVGLFGSAFAAALAWEIRRRSRLEPSALLPRFEALARNRPRVRAVAEGLRRSADILQALATRRPATLALVSVLQVVVQVAAVAEVWLTLVLLGFQDATVLQAFLLEYANRVVTVAFKFVPLRLGVDELASGAMAALLGSGATAGVAVAVIRKARVLCWSAVGLAVAAGRALARR